jgi:hypothetical protein
VAEPVTYVIGQVGHTDPRSHSRSTRRSSERKRDVAARMDALIRGADWAPSGTTSLDVENLSSALETRNPAGAGFFWSCGTRTRT